MAGLTRDDLQALRRLWNGPLPPQEVAFAAHALLGGEEHLASFDEEVVTDKRTRYNIFLLTPTRLIAVRAKGPADWTWSAPSSGGHRIKAGSWPIKALEAIGSRDGEVSSHEFGDRHRFAHRVTVTAPGQKELRIPEFELGRDELREPFQSALLSAWTQTLDDGPPEPSS